MSQVVSFRAAHTHLQAKAAESYAPIQMDAARDVILDILSNPKGHQAAANRSVAVCSHVANLASTHTCPQLRRFGYLARHVRQVHTHRN